MTVFGGSGTLGSGAGGRGGGVSDVFMSSLTSAGAGLGSGASISRGFSSLGSGRALLVGWIFFTSIFSAVAFSAVSFSAVSFSVGAGLVFFGAGLIIRLTTLGFCFGGGACSSLEQPSTSKEKKANMNIV